MQDASLRQFHATESDSAGTIAESASQPASIVARIGAREQRADALNLPLAPSIKAAIMRSLSHEQRLLLVLWYVEAMAPDEIAAVLGTTEARVHQLHEAIVSQLRAEATRMDRGAA